MQLPAAHRSLAARVIGQAVRDVRDPNGTRIDSASARSFLSGSPMLSYWCEIAELDLNCVVDRARTLVAGVDAVAAAAAPPKSTETQRVENLPFRSAALNGRFAELLCRIRGEYLEMPGLQLTAPQARCLFGLDAETWDAVLAALVDAKFLSQTHNGMFAIASNTGVATGRTAGIDVDTNVTR